MLGVRNEYTNGRGNDPCNSSDWLLFPPAVASGTGGSGSVTGTVADHLDAISYGNDDGTVPWAGDWVEVGESSGPGRHEDQLLLNAERFRVEVTWKDFNGISGAGRAVPLTADAGYFWFFDEDNVELVVKVLDGRDVNGHFWVFYGALSNVEYTMRVTDTVTGEVWTRFNPPGTLSSVADTAAF